MSESNIEEMIGDGDYTRLHGLSRQCADRQFTRATATRPTYVNHLETVNSSSTPPNITAVAALISDTLTEVTTEVTSEVITEVAVAVVEVLTEDDDKPSPGSVKASLPKEDAAATEKLLERSLALAA
ncbi:hypothetical protein [Burkholderia cenocepacia]|uniref:hypothetical protein n=1 Tax=Burkholderia cenocepacia TaxID=95486 RepID=UPI002AAF9954|nr:hypothetical protein [Burkholderia cenocepacia]